MFDIVCKQWKLTLFVLMMYQGQLSKSLACHLTLVQVEGTIIVMSTSIFSL